MKAQDVERKALDYGEIVRRSRKNAGVTLKQLESASGVSFQTISHWEHGHVPAADKLDKVLEALGITITLGKK
jgi:transcriptional regulator with XRE-family HTH domain